MLIECSSIQRWRSNDLITAQNADDNFVVIAYGKVVALLDHDGTVYKRLQRPRMWETTIDGLIETRRGKGQVYELSEREWEQTVESMATVLDGSPPSV